MFFHPKMCSRKALKRQVVAEPTTVVSRRWCVDAEAPKEYRATMYADCQLLFGRLVSLGSASDKSARANPFPYA